MALRHGFNVMASSNNWPMAFWTLCEERGTCDDDERPDANVVAQLNGLQEVGGAVHIRLAR